MGKWFSYIDPRALDGVNNNIAAESKKKNDERIKNRIDILRKNGYSDDDILLMLFEEGNHSFNSSKHNIKTKKIV